MSEKKIVAMRWKAGENATVSMAMMGCNPSVALQSAVREITFWLKAKLL